MKSAFVIGLQKTGTSSMVDYNSHPNIFVMYEVNKGNIISKYGSQIINACQKRFDYFAPIGELYSQLHKIINSNFSDNIFL